MIASGRRGRVLPGHETMSRSPLAAALPLVACALGALGALLLSGCAASRQSADGFFARITPYRIEIVQGNVVTSEQVARVRPGLSRAQVRDILGTPLLTDPFHADRWDYLFTLRRDGAPSQRRSVVVRFKGDVLESIDATDLPSEREFVQSIALSRDAVRPSALELSAEQIKALPAPARRDDTPPSVPAGPARTYPPVGD